MLHRRHVSADLHSFITLNSGGVCTAIFCCCSFFFLFPCPLLLSHCVSAHNWESHECGIVSRLDVVKKKKKKKDGGSFERWIMTDRQGGDAGKSKGARVRSHAISTSAAHRRWCNNNITHLISSAYFVSPTPPPPPPRSTFIIFI